MDSAREGNGGMQHNASVGSSLGSEWPSLFPATPWYDPRWRVSSDNMLQAGLRLQQSWWRQECQGIRDAGRLYPPRKTGRRPRSRNPLVTSMLPDTTQSFGPNLMSQESVAAYKDALLGLNSAAGIINEDRLRRNLLSSQPLCFNVFGFLSRVNPNALLPWVRGFAPTASSISRIQLEHAPSAAELGEPPLGGSAFDAFVEYALPGGALGFIGIETKYHEDLARGLKVPAEESRARAKCIRETELRPWRAGASDNLLADRKNLQFWYNQLLAQRTFELVKDSTGSRRYTEYSEVVVACRQDDSARNVVRTVAAQLAEGNQGTLQFAALDDVISAVTGYEEWKADLRRRYTDFSPIQDHLPPGSPLKLA